jgi:RNA polymerase sigma-70 factor (ECF subfamily)
MVEREALERDVRAQWERGDIDGAARAAIRGYGPEILGFLVAFTGNDQDGDDVFAVTCESLWRDLPSFTWRCSFRTWAYTLARHAALKHARSQRRHARRAEPVSSVASSLAQEVRTQTKPYLKTDSKDRFTKLRSTLPPDDQALLMLRVDRKLPWTDLARVMLGETGESADAARLAREGARLRKRFQLVKERLLELGRREGLVPGEG